MYLENGNNNQETTMENKSNIEEITEDKTYMIKYAMGVQIHNHPVL